MQDFIIKLLDLKEEDLDSNHTVSKINQADSLITLKVKDHVCPQCGCFTRYVKDYRTRKLKHKVLSTSAQQYSTDREDISAETAKNHLLKNHRLPETGIR